ncbi:hypothetical protein [Dechloromonas sp. ZS-1]|uniref:hypothetical protein n=1 Tax=Dechloromonas sp. ZS-1 TaxID=3138067 RepID=UPI0031FCAAF0
MPALPFRLSALPLLISLALPVHANTAREQVQERQAAAVLSVEAQRLGKLHLQQQLTLSSSPALIQESRQRVQEALSRIGRSQEGNKRLERLRNQGDALMQRPLGQAASLPETQDLAESLSLSASQLLARLEPSVDQPAARLINDVARLNMLLQRTTRLTLQAAAGDRSVGRQVDIEQARKEFALTLGQLEKNPELMPGMREAVMLARQQWLFFDNALGRIDDPRAQRNLASSSERIYQMLDSIQTDALRDVLKTLR